MKPTGPADDLDWSGFAEAYVAAHGGRRQSEDTDPVGARVAQLIAGQLRQRSSARTPLEDRQSRGTGAGRATDGRAQPLASKLLVALVTEPAGVAGCLERAHRSGGFDWLRDRLEYHGFTRALAWRLTLALWRRRLITSEPNRPYLDHRSREVARRLLQGSPYRPHSAREWELALMLEADSRLSTTGRPARLEAEVVTEACAALATPTVKREAS